MNRDTDAVLAAIDGALMDPELPDGMRWSPEPETVKDPQAMPYDGELVPIPQQHYELNAQAAVADYDQAHADAMTRLRASVRQREDDALDRITGRVQYRHPGGEWEDAVLSPDGWRPRQPENQAGPPPRSPLITAIARLQLEMGAPTPDERARLWQTLGTLSPVDTAALGDSIREAMRADLHTRAERIEADARAALPRVTASPRPGLAPDLLIVEELGPGSVSVRRATDEDVADLLRDAWGRFIEGVTPLVQQVSEVFRRFGDALRNAGWAPTGPPTTPEARRAMGLPPLSPADVRAAALTARRSRPTGPPLVGPEQRPGPRRGPSPATTPRGRQRPRQGRER